MYMNDNHGRLQKVITGTHTPYEFIASGVYLFSEQPLESQVDTINAGKGCICTDITSKFFDTV